ncbi:hypothetical protein [Paenibacillus daejeonensis]|uniref:hypothetical protein n=1 Tax=Paenibacillus daejeonensis TaxID=135193 RepID=UPI000378B0A9|nr:hypothetical protein [Paenibacillus daejeonensis]
MEQFELAEIQMTSQSDKHQLMFASAQLVVVTEMGSRLWYVDVNGIADEALLQYYYTAEDIQIELELITAGGKRVNGSGFFHANPKHQAAAIRGDGELSGL